MGAIARFARAGAGAALALTLIAVHRVAAADTPCDPLLVQKGDWGYTKQKNPDRCEGQYFQVTDNPGSSSVLQPVSLVLRFGDLDPQRDENIRVEWKAPPRSTTVIVTATSLRPEHYYRMDAVVDASKASYYQWPTTITRHEKLRCYELAVMAQTSDGIFLPLTVRKDQGAISTPKPFVVIKAARPLADMQYRLRRTDVQPAQNGVMAPKEVQVTGESITVPLSLPSTGDYRLTVTAHMKDGTPLALPLRFHYAE